MCVCVYSSTLLHHWLECECADAVQRPPPSSHGPTGPILHCGAGRRWWSPRWGWCTARWRRCPPPGWWRRSYEPRETRSPPTLCRLWRSLYVPKNKDGESQDLLVLYCDWVLLYNLYWLTHLYGFDDGDDARRPEAADGGEHSDGQVVMRRSTWLHQSDARGHLHWHLTWGHVCMRGAIRKVRLALVEQKKV